MKEFLHFTAGHVRAAALFCLLITLNGIGVSQAKFLGIDDARASPRTRMGSYPSSTVGTSFLDPEDLGPHSYRFSFSEKNGILYTCKGGHIDIAHLRKAADWMAFIAADTFKKLKENKKKFSFKLMEPSRYHVQVTYPENWKDLSEKEREDIAFGISIRLGEYFIYTATTWHEIITWFGYQCTGVLYSEFASAFTWEDIFSNLLGTHIAAQALRDTEHEYDEAMTIAFARELKELDVQPRQVARRAAEKVRGEWFSGDLIFFINMKKRNFDIGLNDGYVTPSVIQSVPGCKGAGPKLYPVPNLDFLSEYGFSVKLEIEPRVHEKNEILRIVYSGSGERRERIEPDIHFAAIMDYIKEEAITKYGDNVDLSDTIPQAPSKPRPLEPTTAQFLAAGDDALETVESSLNTDAPDNMIEAIASYRIEPARENTVAGDLNGDSKVDFVDFAITAFHWLEPGGDLD